MTAVSAVIKRLATLPQDRQIVDHFWSEEDVRSIARNHGIILTDAQVGAVIDKLEHNFDANVGIDWDVIHWAIQSVTS